MEKRQTLTCSKCGCEFPHTVTGPGRKPTYCPDHRNLKDSRKAVERNIYQRISTDGSPEDVYELGYRNSAGKMCWRTVHGGIEEARATLKELRKFSSPPRGIRHDVLEIERLSETIELNKRTMLGALKATHGAYQRRAWLTIAAFGLAMARRLEVTSKDAPPRADSIPD